MNRVSWLNPLWNWPLAARMRDKTLKPIVLCVVCCMVMQGWLGMITACPAVIWVESYSSSGTSMIFHLYTGSTDCCSDQVGWFIVRLMHSIDLVKVRHYNQIRLRWYFNYSWILFCSVFFLRYISSIVCVLKIYCDLVRLM